MAIVFLLILIHVFPFPGHFIALNSVGRGARVHPFSRDQNQGQRFVTFFYAFMLSVPFGIF
jgi:hypothetical protein